eukprot:scaffold22609_cov20-Tisochrysis_lutea.AAC.3
MHWPPLHKGCKDAWRYLGLRVEGVPSPVCRGSVGGEDGGKNMALKPSLSALAVIAAGQSNCRSKV